MKTPDPAKTPTTSEQWTDPPDLQVIRTRMREIWDEIERLLAQRQALTKE